MYGTCLEGVKHWFQSPVPKQKEETKRMRKIKGGAKCMSPQR